MIAHPSVASNQEVCWLRTDAKQTLDATLMYASKGVPVFPVHFRRDSGECSCGDITCQNLAKHPAVPGERMGGDKHATIDEDQIKRWFGEKGPRRGYNIGASCREGLMCLDVDPKHGGLESLEEFVRDHHPLPDTWVEQTGEDTEGNRGLHFWFLVPPGKQYNRRKNVAGYKGIDLLCDGYAIVAPSIHASGVQYEALTSVNDIVEAPQWLLAMTEETRVEDVLPGGHSLREPTGIRPGSDVRKFLRRGGIEPGRQRNMACKAARALWGIWVNVDDATDLIWEALQKCTWSEGPWTENQVRRLVADEYAQQPKALDNPVGVALATDLGRAYRLRAFARGNLLHDRSQGLWYTWDSTVWRANDNGAPNRLVHAMAMIEYAEGQLAEADGSDRRKEALKIQSASNMNNILSVARDLEGVYADSEQFDSNLYLLNCENCVVDLRTGAQREQKREDYMTRVCNFPYREGAKSKVWENVLVDATSGNEELMDFLQLAFGYAATGDTREDTFFYLHGSGGTGKTTVLEAVAHAIGSYATTADPETFMLAQASIGLSHRADLAALKDARLVTSSEIAQGAKFSTSTLNRLTGRDQISARVPYAKAPLVFKPQWTLFFAANHFPQVPGATKRDGFWRRVKVVPFRNELKPAQMNPVLPYLLAKEEHGQAILAWVVEGALRWWDECASKDRKMKVPHAVAQEVTGMQKQEDQLTDFIETLVFDPNVMVTRSDLHQYYLGWCDKTGTKMPMRPRQFHPAFRSSTEGYDVDEAERQDARYWIGVSIPISHNQPTS
jgi:P4 family phage/plasmid primase-like protien